MYLKVTMNMMILVTHVLLTEPMLLGLISMTTHSSVRTCCEMCRSASDIRDGSSAIIYSISSSLNAT